MSISKTRQKLVDVARQLFAKNGIANTTMNDIAKASGKGRRTLYTYFKSKDDVYSAVIESELERLSDKLDEVANKKISPQDKIIELIYTHLSMIKETVIRNGNLRAEFFRNIWKVEQVRKNFDEDEIELFRKVYSEAKADGEFDIDDVYLGRRHHPLLHQGPGGTVHLRAAGPRADRGDLAADGGQGGLWRIGQDDFETRTVTTTK